MWVAFKRETWDEMPSNPSYNKPLICSCSCSLAYRAMERALLVQRQCIQLRYKWKHKTFHYKYDFIGQLNNVQEIELYQLKSLPGIHFAPHWTPMTASRSMGKKGTNKPTISNRQSVWYENGLCQNTKGNFTINQKSNALIIIHKPPPLHYKCRDHSIHSPSSLRETWTMQGSFVERSHAVNGLHVSCSKTSHINSTIP